MTHPGQAQREALGTFIRSRRKMAGLSLRDLAARTRLSNPYLSQVERGLHQPSVRVLKAISEALNLPTGTLLAKAGLMDTAVGAGTDERQEGARFPTTPTALRTEDAIRADQRLAEEQKEALIAVYRSMLG